MSLLASCRITVRAPTAAVEATAALNATPGVPSVAWMLWIPLMVMSLGPVMLTCMLDERPGPKSNTIIELPRGMVVPLLLAVAPVRLAATPRKSALGVGVEAGAGTVMFTPDVVFPAVTAIGFCVPTAPLPEPELPLLALLLLLLLLPPQPISRPSEMGKSKTCRLVNFKGLLQLQVRCASLRD
jgi:hypothetical protein